MKHIFTLFLATLLMLSLWKCDSFNSFSLSKDTLVAEYSGVTEIYTGLDQSLKIDSLTPECKEGLGYLHIDTIVFTHDTLKWSCFNSETESVGYLLYKTKTSNDTLYGKFIGFEASNKVNNNYTQDDIILLRDGDGFTTPFYYLKRSFHQQFFSFLPLEPLKKDYINTLDTITDTLKYWLINIKFR